ncbi:Abil1 [Thalictrum thalictroides]|uniref:Abil1 n=1 Tax=Thalictrum thalictroides TaxID=46969 RepID=A0A7J6W142_THATH|nr:Abil1 [Thalictrum thalictroides]
MQQLSTEKSSKTFDEVSMERSKSFIKALQELKNLRPQLYSAADYCEKSYLNSEQKQMVLDNLKDYAVRALVNAVDHLGTVAYKLTDLFEQQTTEVSTAELKVSCLNQRLLTCKIYTDKEGLRQQQLFTIIPRHHKHYILPNSFNKKVHFSPLTQIDARQKLILAGPRLHPSGTPASNTLSWHLASETKSTLNGSQHSMTQADDLRTQGTAAAFQLLDGEEAVLSKSISPRLQSATGGPATAVLQTFGVTRRDSSEISKPMTPFRSFDNPGRHGKVQVPVRSKSMLSAFFPKQKNKQR